MMAAQLPVADQPHSRASDGPVVDIHSHLYPRWYIDRLAERTDLPRVARDGDIERLLLFPGERRAGAPSGRPMGPEVWSLEEKLAFMDRFAIDLSVISLGSPWADVFEPAAGLATARRLTDEFAALPAATGGRLLGLGVLPPDLDDGPTVIAEIAAAGLPGIAMGTRPCGRALDDPDLEPVWSAVEKTGLAIQLHPHYGLGMDAMAGLSHSGPIALAFPFETTLAAVRLLTGNVLGRYPGIRFILAHAGGTLPILAGRIDAALRSDPALRETVELDAATAFSRLWLDVAVFDPVAVQAGAELVGIRQLAFGTDHPFSIADPGRTLAAIHTAVAEESLARVLGGTAIELFSLGDALTANRSATRPGAGA
jgi:aminocarboxymuconate-semialdehyde decarboxylase